MKGLRWLLVAFIALAFGLPVSLLLWPINWFSEHCATTVLVVAPSSRFRGVWAIWMAHTFDGVCWRCGSRPPSPKDLMGGLR